MNTFEYASARSPASAAALAGRDGRYVGGGIDLLGEMKEYIVSPNRLVDISGLHGTHSMEPAEDGSFRIGTNVTVAALAADPGIRNLLPGLAEAAAEVGSPQIRAVATVGGNLAQHSRCWYYRQRDLQCLKRGGKMCYAREGRNKFSAIFSGNPCISPVVSNLAVALAVLKASVLVWRGGKEVRLSIPELYEAAWDNPLANNSLRQGDLILSVEVPAAQSGLKSAYLQVSERSDFDWALVSCAAAGRVENGKVSDVRIALGAVAPVPYEAEGATAALEGQVLNEAAAAKAADLLLRDATPFAENGYKVPMAHALIRRTLLKLAA